MRLFLCHTWVTLSWLRNGFFSFFAAHFTTGFISFLPRDLPRKYLSGLGNPAGNIGGSMFLGHAVIWQHPRRKALPWGIRACWSSCFTLIYCFKRCRFEIQIPRWLWVSLNRGRHDKAPQSHGTCPVLIPQTQFPPPERWPCNINSSFLHFPIIGIFCLWNASFLSSLKSLFPMRIWTFSWSAEMMARRAALCWFSCCPLTTSSNFFYMFTVLILLNLFFPAQ